VEQLPDDLNIAAEGVGAIVAGAALGWAGVDRLRGGRPWRVVMLAGGFFVATMIVSIATGASDPQMILVALFAPALGAIASAVDKGPALQEDSN
jgi:F0F1-type ATP synthase assembly protein I